MSQCLTGSIVCQWTQRGQSHTIDSDTTITQYIIVHNFHSKGAALESFSDDQVCHSSASSHMHKTPRSTSPVLTMPLIPTMPSVPLMPLMPPVVGLLTMTNTCGPLLLRNSVLTSDRPACDHAAAKAVESTHHPWALLSLSQRCSPSCSHSVPLGSTSRYLAVSEKQKYIAHEIYCTT